MADKIWIRCDTCNGTGVVTNGVPAEEVKCYQCNGTGVKLIGYIANTVEDAQKALLEEV